MAAGAGGRYYWRSRARELRLSTNPHERAVFFVESLLVSSRRQTTLSIDWLV